MSWGSVLSRMRLAARDRDETNPRRIARNQNLTGKIRHKRTVEMSFPKKLLGVFGPLLLLCPAAAFWGTATPSSLKSSQVARCSPATSLAAFSLR